jgi:hypothetical protein
VRLRSVAAPSSRTADGSFSAACEMANTEQRNRNPIKMDVREAVCNLPVLVIDEFHILIRADDLQYDPHGNRE